MVGGIVHSAIPIRSNVSFLPIPKMGTHPAADFGNYVLATSAGTKVFGRQFSNGFAVYTSSEVAVSVVNLPGGPYLDPTTNKTGLNQVSLLAQRGLLLLRHWWCGGGSSQNYREPSSRRRMVVGLSWALTGFPWGVLPQYSFLYSSE